MSEQEKHDSTRELRELAQRLVDEKLAKDATRREAARASSPTDSKTWETHLAAQRPDNEEVVHERDEQEAKRRRACLVAISGKLKEQGTPLTTDESFILSFLIEKLPGEWNSYDGNDVALGPVTHTEDAVTITFEAYGYEIERKTLPLKETKSPG